MNIAPVITEPPPRGIDYRNIVFEEAPSKSVRWHPYADIFPLIEGAAFQELVEDIRKDGVLEPIVFLNGTILDGRNRHLAALRLGVGYPRVEFEGDDPLAFVLSKNLKRRHLNESQRAMVAAKLATIPHGGDRKSPIGDLKQSDAAALLSVGKRSVERAREVQEHGAAELKEAVEHGKISVSAASDIVTLAEPEQREVMAKSKAEIVAAAKATRTTRRTTGHPRHYGGRWLSPLVRKRKAKEAERQKRDEEEKQVLRTTAILRDRLDGDLDLLKQIAELVATCPSRFANALRDEVAKGDQGGAS